MFTLSCNDCHCPSQTGPCTHSTTPSVLLLSPCQPGLLWRTNRKRRQQATVGTPWPGSPMLMFLVKSNSTERLNDTGKKMETKQPCRNMRHRILNGGLAFCKVGTENYLSWSPAKYSSIHIPGVEVKELGVHTPMETHLFWGGGGFRDGTQWQHWLPWPGFFLQELMDSVMKNYSFISQPCLCLYTALPLPQHLLFTMWLALVTCIYNGVFFKESLDTLGPHVSCPFPCPW